MSVIIRLQNLPWSANSMDIRQFFRGQSIPDGGVNIVGGEKGDAFIAFSTDEDARQAMMKNGTKLKDSTISLLLSSRAEMQKVIEQARARTLSMMSNSAAPPAVTPAVTVPSVAPPTVVPTIPGLNTAIQPPVISLSGFLASNTTPAMRTNNVIEIPGLSNGYTTAAPSLLFNNLPSNMPTIVDTTGQEREKIIGKFGLNENLERESRDRNSRDRDRDRPRRSRRSRSDSSDSSRSRSRERHSPRRRYSRSPDRRRYSRSPDRRRYRSRSPRDRYYRSSSRERSYDSDRDRRGSPVRGNNQQNQPQNQNRNFSSVWAVPPMIQPQQQSNTTAVFQPYTTKTGVRGNGTSNMSSNNDVGFGRDVFGREIRNDRAEEPDACVKVENLDKSTGYGEVRRLFSGLFITNNGIKMINDDYGERIGVAFIRFAKRSDKMTALQRNGTMLRDRKLSILDISDKEYDDAIDSYRPSHNNRHDNRSRKEDEAPDASGPPFSCLKVHDLPPFAKEQDIIKIFSSFTIMQIVMGRNPKKIYEAYVKFYREDDAKQALLATPSFRMAHKFVMISKCSDLEFEAARNEYECATEVVEEVEDVEIVEEKQKSPSPISSPVEKFNDPRMARDPRYRNNHNENSSYSNGSSVQASPMINDYNSDSNNGGQTPSDYSSNNNSAPVTSRDPRRRVDPRVQAQIDNSKYLLLTNVPLHLAEWDISEWLERAAGAEPTKVTLLLNSQRKFNGEVVCEFETSEQAKRGAAGKDNQPLEKQNVRVEVIPKSRFDDLMNVKQEEKVRNNPPMDLPPVLRQNLPFTRPPGMNGMHLPPMGYGPPPNMMMPMRNPPIMPPRMVNGGPPEDDPNFNARVILMENIPYKAGPEEILEYFGPEFDLTPGSIMRRFNERGQPAGEAKVLFHSAADAKQAFNLRKGNKIMGRSVYLKLNAGMQ
ncbi:uncharacterized protein LOC134829596 [Culicoides brevitarsis]|uniref:uncharacterized protein LOC134829596 n=1 Tax=Culicoides brevitarsis TaxID=469753 RepID=UPI00307BC5A2